MCGFVGFFQKNSFDAKQADACLKAMCSAISYRGPDGEGFWQDPEAGIALGHRRLSIIDLSPAGHQPMVSFGGRFMIAFNGEIYNHEDLRGALSKEGQAPSWHGHSDTETLLACFEVWGIKKTILKARGMFSFAVWDRKERVLTLGRDRLGEKPLYYGWQGRGLKSAFLFGSELKALRAHPSFEGGINRDSLALFMRHNAIGGSYSIYNNIAKLEPGCLLRISAQDLEPKIDIYWSAADVALEGKRNQFTGSADDAVEALDILLRDAVKSQMMSDVPLGAFLSGGIDSSTIVALMQAQSSERVKTFSIGFHEAFYNEAEHAKEVARHLGTKHTELYVTPEETRDVIPKLPSLYDEPFSDSSQIPTYLVSKLARGHVTVSLSGDAGDELFAGYTRYQMTAQMWRKISICPKPLRRAVGSILTQISPHGWNKIASILGMAKDGINLGHKVHKGAGVLTADSASDLYYSLVSHWQQPNDLVLGGKEPPTYLTGKHPDLSALNDVERMMALDLMTYLTDDILVKTDRAAMGVSLEGRVPLLDHRVVEFAWRLPLEYKLREGQTKWVLRQVLDRYVPRPLIDRPKMGFGVPIDVWLRGPLRAWAEDLLDENRLRQEGFLNPDPIRQKWKEHLSGSRNWQYHLWDVLMFEAWLAENK